MPVIIIGGWQKRGNMKYKIGDFVIIPNAYDMTWEPYITRVEAVRHTKDEPEYLVQYKANMIYGVAEHESWFPEHKVFQNIKDCQKYIYNYYYDGLCKPCKYNDFCGNYTCRKCEHYLRYDVEHHTFTKCNVSGFHVCPQHEICEKYKSVNPLYYPSYELYEDYLRNCLFNKNCEHHRYSCNKTVTYEKYMDEYVIQSVYEFEYQGRTVDAVKMKRKDWLKNEYHDKENGTIICEMLCLKPVYTEKGHARKGTVNNIINLGKPTVVRYKEE